jgi:hypothetical protein
MFSRFAQRFNKIPVPRCIFNDATTHRRKLVCLGLGIILGISIPPLVIIYYPPIIEATFKKIGTITKKIDPDNKLLIFIGNQFGKIPDFKKEEIIVPLWLPSNNGTVNEPSPDDPEIIMFRRHGGITLTGFILSPMSFYVGSTFALSNLYIWKNAIEQFRNETKCCQIIRKQTGNVMGLMICSSIASLYILFSYFYFSNNLRNNLQIASKQSSSDSA